MSEKYEQLVDEACTVSDHVTDADAVDAMIKSHGGRRSRRVVLGVILVLVCLCALLATLFLTGFILKLQWRNETNDFFTYEKTLASGVMQSVRASVAQNTVEYYIDTHISEQTWIIDDFNLNLEIMKSVTEERTICYVSQLNGSEAVHPARVTLPQLLEKKQYHSVLTPDPYPVNERTLLGSHGGRLCADVDVYWLRPMDDIIDLTDSSPQLMNTTDIETGEEARSKRNIRSCHASCCWLVCCCDVHHFKWERTEQFTCRHVCDPCSKAYKQKIQKLC